MVGTGSNFKYQRQWLVLVLTAILAVLAVTASIAIGPVRIGFLRVWEILMSDNAPVDISYQIVWNIRLPRTLVGCMVGAGLALSGALLQGVMRNPLADPHIIGVSAGAGLAAVAALTIFPQFPPSLIPAAAFGGALTSATLVYGLAWRAGVSPMRLILSGVAVSSLMSAGTSALLVLFSENVQAVMGWLVGGLAGRGWPHWAQVWPYVTVAGVITLFTGRQVNLLLLGDEMATGLGVKVEQVRLLLIALASVLAAAAVSVAGLIGFVGLVVPHIIRLLMGSDYRFLLPASALGGAALLTLADVAARMVMDPIELPVGILTASFGAPFFLYLLRRGHHH
ncbi:MAG: iron ABC transporter permease [Firmicutes bacterium]|nr:iron ABC transporter permease [Bacillota bacterium]